MARQRAVRAARFRVITAGRYSAAHGAQDVVQYL